MAFAACFHTEFLENEDPIELVMHAGRIGLMHHAMITCPVWMGRNS